MSASEDKRVNIWDITRLGARQGVEERKYGPPELMFQHAGHRFPVRCGPSRLTPTRWLAEFRPSHQL
jgi:hypothetical protein